VHWTTGCFQIATGRFVYSTGLLQSLLFASVGSRRLPLAPGLALHESLCHATAGSGAQFSATVKAICVRTDSLSAATLIGKFQAPSELIRLLPPCESFPRQAVCRIRPASLRLVS
jgi:hypothetical protein